MKCWTGLHTVKILEIFEIFKKEGKNRVGWCWMKIDRDQTFHPTFSATSKSTSAWIVSFFMLERFGGVFHPTSIDSVHFERWYIRKNIRKLSNRMLTLKKLLWSLEISSSDEVRAAPLKGKLLNSILKIRRLRLSMNSKFVESILNISINPCLSSILSSVTMFWKYPLSSILLIQYLVFPRVGFSSSESISSFNTRAQTARFLSSASLFERMNGHFWNFKCRNVGWNRTPQT